MLPADLRPHGFGTFEREHWEAYAARVGLGCDEAVRQFHRQVTYDHFDHFNEHYPDLRLPEYTIAIEQFSAQQAYDQVRYLDNDPVDFWSEQFDQFERCNDPYLIYQAMARDRTPPFPPVVIESALMEDDGWRVYGRPYHLSEGTHRVGYLRRIFERGLVSPVSLHRFVVLRPVTTTRVNDVPPVGDKPHGIGLPASGSLST